jgi:hypothetical protein
MKARVFASLTSPSAGDYNPPRAGPHPIRIEI